VNKTVASIILVILICLLAARFYIYNSNKIIYTDGQTVLFSARLVSVPESDGRFQNFSLSQPGAPKLFISTTRYPEYSYGDVFQVTGRIEKKDIEDYTIYTMSYPKVVIVPDRNVFYGLLSFIRERITGVYEENLPQTSASLLIGIVFGIKEAMPDEFSDALRTVGVMHVIAASGMNVSMVAGAIFMIFSSFLNRRKAIIFSLAAIIFYAFLAGFEASIVRATLMAGIAFTASYFGRQYYGFLALCLTVYAMLIFNPGYLTDVGFQLSFLATLGILYVKPPELLTKKDKTTQATKWYQGVLDDLRVTVAAQIATLPILLFSFGQYGLLSVPVNALVLWTIPVLMVLGSIAAVFSLTLPILAKPFLYLALPFLLYFETVVTWAAGLGFSLDVGKFSWTFVAGYYAILLAVILMRQKRKSTSGKLRKLSNSENQKVQRVS
jgi:competence protein ComEC